MLGNMRRGLSSSDRLTVAAFVVFSALLLLVWVYWATESTAALSILCVCSSLILFIILTPFQYIDCKRMYKREGRATSNLETVLGVMGGLLVMTCYTMGTLNAFSGDVSSTQIICASIEFIPFFALPLAWIVCRAYEQYHRAENTTVGLPSYDGRAGEFSRDQVGYASYRGRDETYSTVFVPTFLIVRDVQGRGVDTTREAPQVFVDEGHVLGR